MDEIGHIREKYDKGELDQIRRDLEQFLVAHRERIRDLQQKKFAGKTKLVSPEVAVKLYILQHRSINPAREIREQLHEINREKWIHGEMLGRPPDSQAVARSWARKHAVGWRSHRVMEIVFVFDQEKKKYLKILEKGFEK